MSSVATTFSRSYLCFAGNRFGGRVFGHNAPVFRPLWFQKSNLSVTNNCHSPLLLRAEKRVLHNPCYGKDLLFRSYSRTMIPWRTIVGTSLSSMVQPFMMSHRTYSSHGGEKSVSVRNAEPTPDLVSGTSNSQSTDSLQNSWMDALDGIYQRGLDAATAAGHKARELSDFIGPQVQQLYDKYPHLEKVIVPVSSTLSAAVIAWFVLPVVLKQFHKYTTQNALRRLLGSSSSGEVAYRYSMWSALEDPTKYLFTFMAISQLCAAISPSISGYLPQAWKGAAVLSFVWFLHRWKGNYFAHEVANQLTLGLDRDKLATFDRFSSLGLIALGVMGVAEACGVAVQSILTVGGVGGVATAFAARDLLGNMLTGLSLQFSRPFSVGDNIKAGPIEGQVVEIGLTTTSLINPEKYPVLVPNSFFSSQAIVNKSRAQWRASLTKIPVKFGDIETVIPISEQIKDMLKAHPKVFMEKDGPYCYLSRLESSFGELTIGCNLRTMRKDELFAAEQDILLQAARIIRQNGCELGSTLQYC